MILHTDSLQTLIVDLARSLDEHQDSANLQIAVLSFVNAIINYKAGEVSCPEWYHTMRCGGGRPYG